MPKGFNKKAIEGFRQWITAVLENTSLNEKERKQTIEEMTNLLDKGFPKIRSE